MCFSQGVSAASVFVVRGRRNLLLNKWEQSTDKALNDAAARCGLRVVPKVRLASALELDGSGLSRELFAYGLQAEFDFVVADGEWGTPQFAVEFDEPHHLTDAKTLARDRKKAAICKHLELPLVRIGSEYLRQERRFTLIGYLVETWKVSETIADLQASGQLPADEIFTPEDIVGEFGSGEEWPFWLDRPARQALYQAYSNGDLVRSWVPEQIFPSWARNGAPEPELIESWALIQLSGGNFVTGQARLRNFEPFITGVSARSLAASVAVADLGRQLEAVLAGTKPSMTAAELVPLRERTAGWARQGAPAGDA